MGSNLQRSDKGVMGFLKAITMNNIDRINSINSNVVEYKPCNVDSFFDPGHGVYNAIVSGGDPRLRTSAMVAQAICAIHNGFPVVVLHEGNKLLEQQLRSSFWNTGKYREISCNNPCFEPFYGLSDLKVSNQILATVPNDYGINHNVRYYVDGISALLKASGKNRSFKLFSSCPHHMILDKVDDLKVQGKINDYEAQNIKSKLIIGQSENYKLDTFFANMKTEVEPLLYVSKRGYKPMNVITALKSNLVLSIDLVSVTNKLLLNTLIYQLKLALSKRMQYQIIIDSIPINTSESYASYIRSPSDKVCKTIVADDFFTMVGSDEKVFSTIVGKSHILIVMNHLSSNSAAKWADVFGYYEKIEKSVSRSYGTSGQTLLSMLLNLNYNRMVNIDKKCEYVVKPETIKKMRNDEAYVLSNALGGLAHLHLTDWW